ncbi:BTAD domain-containing putative transcriptional regulator [Streptomyces sp. NPDC001820]|uniref:AfsR/SARP family transcriptional regulator n=1 Tax=Streptomyces sp. NPDC001820 TaxID=3364613 RepID=UPI0036C1DBA8
MRYRVLGTTQAFHDDGTPVALGGARLRALLAVLALRPGRTVPVGVLVDEVWAGDPPADAVGAVQALVGRLRRALGHAAVASAAGGGYRLCADGDDVDLHRFDRRAGEGARALDEGDAVKAAALLDDALGLWQGPVLADLPDRTAEAARWEARRLDARRARLAAALALGRADEALPELAALCEEHPMDERLQVLRLRAMRDAGRTAEALAAYEGVRTVLADRLGADPGRELRALHAELLAPASLLEASPQTPRFSGVVLDLAQSSSGGTPTGSSFRPAGGNSSPADETSKPLRRLRSGAPGADPNPATPTIEARGPGRSPGPAPGNLRARLTSFVGRDADIHAIHDDLRRARLVTLLGPGGAGKTRLSQEAAERAVDGAGAQESPWPDGVWLAELAPVDDPETVPEAVLTALGARETVLRGAGAEELRAAERHSDDPLVRLAEHCSRRRMLLLLDNCEHVVDAAATLAERLLESCPDVTVLATSREPLGVPGELVRPVGPLPDPMALQLLADRGAAARPGFRIDADEATAAASAEICHRLDGLPLAIELAAARLRMLTPRQIADRLDDRFRLLTSGSRTVLPRQQTLRAVVDWSWDLLDDAERAVLRRLSVFAGGCDLPAAEAVCADSGTDRGSLDVADALGSLIDKSLVVAAPTSDGQMRYRLLETVGEYAAERLDEAAERAAVEWQHLLHYRELARTTDPLLRGHGQRAAIGLLQLEYENLRTALRRAVAARDEQEALHLLLSLAWYWQMKDLRTEARHWTTVVGELGPDPFASPVEPAQPVFERFTDAPPPMSPELLQEARRGAALIRMVFMDYDMDEWTSPERLERLGRVTQVYRPGLPQTCRPPGSLWFFAVVVTGDNERLRELLNETVDACRAYGYEWELAASLQARANVLANRSQWAGDAAGDADEALEIFTRLGDAWGAAEALSARGEAHERRGEYPLAAEDFTAAIRYAERIGAQAQAAVLRTRLGGNLMETGEGERGEALIREVLATGTNLGNESTAIARLLLGLWLGRTGRTQEARIEIERLLEQFRSNTFAIFEGIVFGYLAWLDLLDGEYEPALERARTALAKAKDPLTRMVAPQMPSVYMVTAAGALARGRPERAPDAARLLGASDAMLPHGHFAPHYERENRASSEAAVRTALGDDAAYEAAYAEGGGLSPDEAAALV